MALPGRAEETAVGADPGVDVREHLGGQVPPDLVFTGADGKPVRFGDLLAEGRPTVVVLAYYSCPMLCGVVLKGLADALPQTGRELGKDFRAVTVSIDPRDTPQTARQKQASLLAEMKRPDSEAERWPFLTGDQESITRLADALGFVYRYDEKTDQYAHPAVVFVLTPQGRISRYLYGIDWRPADLRLALSEAAEGRFVPVLDRVILSCFRYDPATRRYGPYIFGFLRIGSSLVALTLGIGLFRLWRRDLRQRRRRS